MKSFITSSLFSFAIACAIGQAHADDLDDALKATCNKMKQCIVETISQSGVELLPEMQQMVDTMSAQMCVEIDKGGEFARQHDLEDSAVACMQSMIDLSCSEIENETTTPQCIALEQQTQAYQ